MAFFQSERLEDRRRGKRIIEALRSANAKTLVIHYSCESFYNTHGKTPRVTGIAVRNRGSQSSKIFSIHFEAQLHQKDLSCLSDEDFNFLEKQMLKSFYDYVKNHNTHNWVHWNMRNANYGFEAIANRYRILGGKPVEIEDQFKFDLPEVLKLVHTDAYEEHKPNGKLLNLAGRNAIPLYDAQNGQDESDAFDKRDFLTLQNSTSRKVEIIDKILTLEEKDQLKVNISIFKECGVSMPGIIEIVRNNWLLFAIWSVAMAILGAAMEPIFQHLFGTDRIGN